MKPFLYKVAETFYTHHREDVSRLAFVFSNRRAGLFFKKYLAQVAGKPIFVPRVYTINDLLVSVSSFRLADKTEMLFSIYELYQQLSHSAESFDKFAFWGEMLLNDFDDVDKYLVDAKQLFTNIKELKEIDEKFFYLTPEQLAAIRRFWVHFMEGGDNEKKRNFAAVWEILFPLYSAFKEKLALQGLAYEGMIFREIAEKARRKEDLSLPAPRLIFVGLNVLTLAEETVLRYLKGLGVADFYWDYTSSFVCDPANKASFFVARNRTMFPSQYEIAEENLSVPEIELIGLPSSVGQAKQVYDLLERWMDEGAIPHPDKAIDTAVVLPDEHLLLPVLHSLPREIDPVNVTMGYLLTHTPVSGLIDLLFELQKQVRFVKGEPSFYHRTVSALLSHQYVSQVDKDETLRLLQEIRRYNKIFIPLSDLSGTPLFRCIFRVVVTPDEASDYIMEVLESLQTFLKEPEEGTRVSAQSFDKEYLYHYYVLVKRLKEVMVQHNVSMELNTFFQLLGKMAVGVSVPFQGEPLAGLQVMGVLETRSLDFDNLIILSVNEGVFPLSKAANSFIPYNLRKGFGLSTHEHQDSIYAYYFYRMISRARRVVLLYDTRTEGLQTGEVSRYVYQLKHLYGVKIKESTISYDVRLGDVAPITVAKTSQVLARLSRFLAGGDRALSASVINTYINCPLQFYLQYVENVIEEDEVTESIEADSFGSIFHGVMERIYQRMSRETVTADILKKIASDESLLTSYIEDSFAEHFFKSRKVGKLTGQNFLVGEIIRKYVKQVLKKDAQMTPFVYIESERLMNLDFPLKDGRKVRLKAYVDRIDRKGTSVRIIDYKTGAGKPEFRSVQDLFDAALPNRPKAVMQVFMYAMMYNRLEKPEAIVPGIYYLRSLFNDTFQWNVLYRPEKKSETVADYLVFDVDFVSALEKCLCEIFDEQVPFVQTAQIHECKYCAFASICKK